MKQLEIACFNLESAIIAEQGGANRIELCKEQHLGGTTPDIETVREARDRLTIDLYVMIRPRGGDFCYNEKELEQMKADIIEMKSLGVTGFVFGILNQKDEVDKSINTELVRLAAPLPCTFHRAFDEIADLEKGIDDLVACGFTTILTSGGYANVDEGERTLMELVAYAGKRIIIMPGGGLRSANSYRIATRTNAAFYHSSAITDATGIASLEEVKALRKNLSDF
ncbi:copper homeostasis protein CutC [Flavobacterium cerinum]|uniref:PF03932 family protein CutC n=1 Tax=Flavobacterium cerinum TaxID=2502784 RepID=A0ABY5IZQ4_9FLAO|nr:copper homeostasis protein CutC [Flavobacterium cerinum]UUC46804.1 copper homeostasis protein CutC [Flavobacterium cerinum]